MEPPSSPPWLAPATRRAMAAARDSARTRGLGAAAVAEAVRDVLRARHPALPAAMLAEAAAALLPPPPRERRLPHRPSRLPAPPRWP